jgi:hypothetical protein
MSNKWLVRNSDGYAFREEGAGKYDKTKFKVVESDTNPMDAPPAEEPAMRFTPPQEPKAPQAVMKGNGNDRHRR